MDIPITPYSTYFHVIAHPSERYRILFIKFALPLHIYYDNLQYFY